VRPLVRSQRREREKEGEREREKEKEREREKEKEREREKEREMGLERRQQSPFRAGGKLWKTRRWTDGWVPRSSGSWEWSRMG
jgi:hypothetical protein